jgi:pimeloyl-ACP methyl ester carboxylesterase
MFTKVLFSSRSLSRIAFGLALTTLSLVANSAATLAAIAEPLKTCRVAGLRHPAQCGVLKRLLDPAQPNGVQIDIHYVVVPALARRKLPDPVFLLAGGPGQSAIALAPQVLALFTRLNNRRDIVFVDQRGTGLSAPLMCDDTRAQPLAELADPAAQLRQITRCREKLQTLPYGDLRFFTTVLAMQDLDAVRQQLGVQRINLIGASYGTRAALDYQRQFPNAVRRSVMDGVAPADMVLPLSMSTDNQAAFDALLRDCEQAASCQKRHPNLRRDASALFNTLPQSVSAAHPMTGQRETFVYSRDMLLAALRGPLYSPAMASALPHAISEAAAGRFEGLLGMGSLLSPRKSSALAMGMHFSVICSEDTPRVQGRIQTSGADFADSTAQLYAKVCAAWPQGAVPAAFYEVPPARSPVLLLSGGLDPATPPRHAQRVALALGANALNVVVPNAGHGGMSVGCLRDVIYKFIDTEEDTAALKVRADCAAAVPRPLAFQPPRLDAKLDAKP